MHRSWTPVPPTTSHTHKLETPHSFEIFAQLPGFPPVLIPYHHVVFPLVHMPAFSFILTPNASSYTFRSYAVIVLASKNYNILLKETSRTLTRTLVYRQSRASPNDITMPFLHRVLHVGDGLCSKFRRGKNSKWPQFPLNFRGLGHCDIFDMTS